MGFRAGHVCRVDRGFCQMGVGWGALRGGLSVYTLQATWKGRSMLEARFSFMASHSTVLLRKLSERHGGMVSMKQRNYN